MLIPNQFRVNEAWIAFRANDKFFFIKNEPYDIYALIDVASCFVLGYILSKVTNGIPSEKDVQDLFKQAWTAKGLWAEKLILSENSTTQNIFRKQAEQNGLRVEIVPLSDLELIVTPVKESFASAFTGNTPLH